MLSQQASWTGVVVESTLLSVAATTAFLLAAVPVYGLLRSRLVLPVLLGARTTYLAVTLAGDAMHDFLEVYFFPPFALVALGLLIAVTALEFGVRAGTGVATPKPLC